MDVREFEWAMENELPEPNLEALILRFQHAFEATDGNRDAALAVVNELLVKPVSYDAFLARLREASE